MDWLLFIIQIWASTGAVLFVAGACAFEIGPKCWPEFWKVHIVADYPFEPSSF